MAPRKLSQLPVATEVAELDKLLITDVSDLTASPAGTSKQVSLGVISVGLAELLDLSPTIGDTIEDATAGRVLYVGAGGVLAQHAGLTYDDATGAFGATSIAIGGLSADNMGIKKDTGDWEMRVWVAAQAALSISQLGLLLRSNGAVSWSSSSNPSITTGGDVNLVRDAANVLAMWNGANPQTFRVYGNYGDADNYERGYACWVSNVFTIGTEAAGTGTVRTVAIKVGANVFASWDVDGDAKFFSQYGVAWMRYRASDGGILFGDLNVNSLQSAIYVVTPFVQDGSGTRRVRLDQTNIAVQIPIATATDAGLVVRAAASQTAALAELQDNDTKPVHTFTAGIGSQSYLSHNTYTDSSNYERGYARWVSNVFTVGTEAAGTGTQRNVRISAGTYSGSVSVLGNIQIESAVGTSQGSFGFWAGNGAGFLVQSANGNSLIGITNGEFRQQSGGGIFRIISGDRIYLGRADAGWEQITVRLTDGGISITPVTGLLEVGNTATPAGIQMRSMGADPVAPAAGNGVTFFRTNGGGKMEYCVRFPSGAIQVIATEP